MATVTEEDLSAVLEGYSFGRLWWFQAFMAGAMVLLGAVLLRLFHTQVSEGWALMEDMPWMMPVLTFIHAALAFLVVARSRIFIRRHWQSGPIDPLVVAHLGWRSAPERTPTEVCILLIEATTILRLAAYAALALFGMAVLWIGIATSDLLKLPFYWINAASYMFWWGLWFQSFLTSARALKCFRRCLPPDTSTLEVGISS